MVVEWRNTPLCLSYVSRSQFPKVFSFREVYETNSFPKETSSRKTLYLGLWAETLVPPIISALTHSGARGSLPSTISSGGGIVIYPFYPFPPWEPPFGSVLPFWFPERPFELDRVLFCCDLDWEVAFPRLWGRVSWTRLAFTAGLSLFGCSFGGSNWSLLNAFFTPGPRSEYSGRIKVECKSTFYLRVQSILNRWDRFPKFGISLV